MGNRMVWGRRSTLCYFVYTVALSTIFDGRISLSVTQAMHCIQPYTHTLHQISPLLHHHITHRCSSSAQRFTVASSTAVVQAAYIKHRIGAAYRAAMQLAEMKRVLSDQTITALARGSSITTNSGSSQFRVLYRHS